MSVILLLSLFGYQLFDWSENIFKRIYVILFNIFKKFYKNVQKYIIYIIRENPIPHSVFKSEEEVDGIFFETTRF